jgi:hypothetical protein
LVTVGEMVIPVPALPLLFQIAVADSVPNWDVTPSCRAAAAAALPTPTQDRQKHCMDSEDRARDKVTSDPHFRRQTELDALIQ